MAGRLSTHVLDLASGKPAPGLALKLRGPGGLAVRAVTNADGRTDAPLAEGRLALGTYELDFDVGAYYKAGGLGGPEPAFLGVVTVRFAVAEPEGRYHVPLLVSPYGYSTYRGS